MTEESLRNYIVDYAKSWLRTPYEWGDEDHTGMDCSGLACEVAQAAGLIKHRTRVTARRLFAMFSDSIVVKAKPGCFIFYGNPDKITHVAIAIDEDFIVEAGGGYNVIDAETADKYAAFVRQRPRLYRKDQVAICDPVRMNEC